MKDTFRGIHSYIKYDNEPILWLHTMWARATTIRLINGGEYYELEIINWQINLN